MQTPGPVPDGKYTRITAAAALPALVESLEPAAVISLDLETTGLDPRRHRTRLLSLSTPRGTWLVDCFQVDPRPLFPLLGERQLVGHNLQFDLGFLAELGFEPGKPGAADTILQARLLSAGSQAGDRKGYHALGAVVQRELGFELPKELQRSDWSGELSPEQLEYAARDVQVLDPLYNRLAARLVDAGIQHAAEIERRCLPAVVWMGRAGIGLDAATWRGLADEAEAEAALYREELDRIAPAAPEQLALGVGWQWNKPDIIKRVLALCGHPVRDIRDETLNAIDHPVAEALRHYRAATSRLSKYGHNWLALLQDGRIYPDWKQMGSRAGRMSCEKPPAQGFPRDLRYRGCVVAGAGKALVKADYSQIELRIAAVVAHDPRMLEAYRTGEDLHTLTARQLLGREFADDAERKAFRQLAKAINFGLLYGMGWETLRIYARISYGVEMTAEEAQRYRNTFFRIYAGLARWHGKVRREQGPETRTLSGRRRILPPGTPTTHRLNTPIQGTGADGLKRAMALLWERRAQRPDAQLILAAHDELVVECDADHAAETAVWLERAMLDGMQPLLGTVPVAVEVKSGPTWAL